MRRGQSWQPRGSTVAEVVLYDRSKQVREELAAEIAEQRSLTLIPPYDHVDVLAGQGTAARELFEQVGDLDLLLVCLGGGGAAVRFGASGSPPLPRMRRDRCRAGKCG